VGVVRSSRSVEECFGKNQRSDGCDGLGVGGRRRGRDLFEEGEERKEGKE